MVQIQHDIISKTESQTRQSHQNICHDCCKRITVTAVATETVTAYETENLLLVLQPDSTDLSHNTFADASSQHHSDKQSQKDLHLQLFYDTRHAHKLPQTA